MGMTLIDAATGAYHIHPHNVLRIYRIAVRGQYVCDCLECSPRLQNRGYAEATWEGRTLADRVFWLCDECYAALALPELPDINLFGLLSDCHRKLDAILGGLNA